MVGLDQELEDQELEEIEEEEKKMPRFLGIILGIIVVLGLVGGAFAVTHYVLLPMYRANKYGTDIIDKEKEPMGDIFFITDLTVNPLSSNGRRFVVAEFAIEIRNKKVFKEIMNREPQLRNEFIEYFRRHTAQEVLDISFQRNSSRELIEVVNNKLLSGVIDSLYYTKLIVQ